MRLRAKNRDLQVISFAFGNFLHENQKLAQIFAFAKTSVNPDVI